MNGNELVAANDYATARVAGGIEDESYEHARLKNPGKLPFIPINHTYKKVFASLPEEISAEHFNGRLPGQKELSEERFKQCR